MKTKCLICNKKDSKTSITVTEWIIKDGQDAKIGEDVEIHASCLSKKLYVERPEGFIHGKVAIHKPKKRKKKSD